MGLSILAVVLKQTKAAPDMAEERTFIAVKPDGVQRGLVGEIMSRFEKRGYKLVAAKLCMPGKAHLEKHYSDLSSKMLGATNPLDSEPGTIRGDFCIEVGRNVCHGSDAVESAKKEIDLWFKKEELNEYVAHNKPWVYE